MSIRWPSDVILCEGAITPPPSLCPQPSQYMDPLTTTTTTLGHKITYAQFSRFIIVIVWRELPKSSEVWQSRALETNHEVLKDNVIFQYGCSQSFANQHMSST